MGDAIFEMAEEIGNLLAQAGFTIANGGYGGTMTAAAKGASEAGGEIIGVTCSAFKNSKPNKYITREIVTESLDERLDTLIKLGQAYIVLPGGTGGRCALSEGAHSSLQPYRRPVPSHRRNQPGEHGALPRVAQRRRHRRIMVRRAETHRGRQLGSDPGHDKGSPRSQPGDGLSKTEFATRTHFDHEHSQNQISREL